MQVWGWVGHAGVGWGVSCRGGWVMQGWGQPCRGGGVGHMGGVGWVTQGWGWVSHVGVGWVLQGWGVI